MNYKTILEPLEIHLIAILWLTRVTVSTSESDCYAQPTSVCNSLGLNFNRLLKQLRHYAEKLVINSPMEVCAERFGAVGLGPLYASIVQH